MRRWWVVLLILAAAEAPVHADERCELIRLDEDGALVVRFEGAAQRMAIFGLRVAEPSPALYVEIIGKRLPHGGGDGLRCTVRAAGAPRRSQFHYLAWRDKSGDVWQDLALTLLDQGVAQVSDEDFPERAEYLRHEKR